MRSVGINLVLFARLLALHFQCNGVEAFLQKQNGAVAPLGGNLWFQIRSNHARSNQGRCQRAGRFASNDDSRDIDENVDKSRSSTMISKSKWKKKRYLMMNDVANCIQQGDPNAPRKAEEMVRRMKRLYEKNIAAVNGEVDEEEDDFCRPTIQAYNLWIHALAKSNLPDAGTQAEAVLRQVQAEEGLAPTIITYASVMDAYAHQAKMDRKAPEQAERILFELLDECEHQRRNDLVPTDIVYDTVLNAWTKQSRWEGAERAEHILQQLEQVGNGIIRPTAHSYATVLHGWATCNGGREAALRAQAILDQLLEQSTKKENAVLPDTVIFNAVIHAWANSRDPQAGSKGVALLNQMQELNRKKGYSCPPDTVTYNTVLSAWSHSGHLNAATQSERILQEMLMAHRQAPDSAPTPNTISYNNVLNAWSKSNLEGAAERAEKVLQFMILSKQEEIAPDVYSFSSALDALAKSKIADKVARANTLLETLLTMYEESRSPSLKPSQVPFNAVLNAAAFSALGATEEQKRDALKTAVRTFSLMRTKRVPPDTISYGNMLKCFGNLLPPGKARNELALQVFQQCCEEGYVGELVWNEAKRVLPHKLLADSMGLEGHVRVLQVHNLPRQWTQRTLKSKKKRVQDKAPIKRKEKGSAQDSEKNRAPVQRLRNISESSYQSGRDL